MDLEHEFTQEKTVKIKQEPIHDDDPQYVSHTEYTIVELKAHSGAK